MGTCATIQHPTSVVRSLTGRHPPAQAERGFRSEEACWLMPPIERKKRPYRKHLSASSCEISVFTRTAHGSGARDSAANGGTIKQGIQTSATAQTGTKFSAWRLLPQWDIRMRSTVRS